MTRTQAMLEAIRRRGRAVYSTLARPGTLPRLRDALAALPSAWLLTPTPAALAPLADAWVYAEAALPAGFEPAHMGGWLSAEQAARQLKVLLGAAPWMEAGGMWAGVLLGDPAAEGAQGNAPGLTHRMGRHLDN